MTQRLEQFAGASCYPMLLVSRAGRLLVANAAARQALMIPGKNMQHATLFACVTDPQKRVSEYLQTWARTRDPISRSLTWRCPGQNLPLDVEGRLIEMGDNDAEAVLCLACRPKHEADRQALHRNEKVLALPDDVRLRDPAQAAPGSEFEWLDVTLSSIADAVVATDCNATITFMNATAQRLTGWSLANARGKPVLEVLKILDESTRQIVESPVQRVIREGAIVLANHVILVARNGREIPIEESIAPIRDNRGNLIGVVLVVRDVTDRKQAEQAQRDGEERLHAIVEAAVDGIITINAEGIIESVNPAVERIFGYARSELMGQNVKMLMPEPYRREHDGYLRNYRETGVPKIIGIGREVVGRRKDGSTFPMDMTVSEVKLADRRIFTGIIRDVSDRVRAEQELRESEARFRNMADAAPVMIRVTNANMECTYINKPWLEFTGRAMREELGSGWAQGVHPEDYPRLMERYAGAFARHEPFRMEYRLRNRDHAYRWLLEHGLPRVAPDGTFIGYIGSCIDIHERRQLEQRLRLVNESLEERILERTAVAERRATQLRALAFELTQAEQRERRKLAQTLHDHLQQLLVAAKLRLGAMLERVHQPELSQTVLMVKDLLKQSIEVSRSLTVELSPPILYDAGLAAALNWLARHMHEKHALHVHLDIQCDTDPVEEGVRVILFDAVRELVFNAVKHANVDHIRVTLARADGMIRITVEDEGVGFDPQVLEDRAASSESFGLFSIRERLDVLGGRLDIDAVPQHGTRVTMLAPMGPVAPGRAARGVLAAAEVQLNATARPQGEPVASKKGKIRVLLADDHRILREGLVGLLQPLPDVEVVGEAANGQMAVEMARELRPDVIIMDISMPKMTGIEATRIITGELPEIRVVALSMHEEEDMSAAMSRAGAVAYLPKDGPADALIHAIRGK